MTAKSALSADHTHSAIPPSVVTRAATNLSGSSDHNVAGAAGPGGFRQRQSRQRSDSSTRATLRTSYSKVGPSSASASPSPSSSGSSSTAVVADATISTFNVKAAHDLSTTTLLCPPNSRHYKDQHGRSLLLRGVNACGHSKLPTYPATSSTHMPHDEFFDHRNVSFVGRPFALDEADEHFQRLRSWGLTFVRLLVPWESLEHKGPGIYDEEFISYLVKILEKADSYGLKCFIDPHQDTWSRFSGGSGAPGWTFEVAGMDLSQFKLTAAAHVHNLHADTPNPHMFWPGNYAKLACSTMFTLFFGGNTFAPNARGPNGQLLGDFLQQHFVNAYAHLAQRLKHVKSVVGFELMNEPHYGYIGLPSLYKFSELAYFHFGPFPNAIESFALGDGMEVVVGNWIKSWPHPTRRSGSVVVNSERKSAWLPNSGGCIWKRHGVWDLDPKTNKPRVLKPNYFSHHPVKGQPIDFYSEFYIPFIHKYYNAIRAVNPEMQVLVEPIPNEDPMVLEQKTRELPGLVYAPHWYDLKALSSKSFGVITHDVQGLVRGMNIVSATYIGLSGALRNYTGQIRNIVNNGMKSVGTRPIVFGEVGIPMDINEKKAYETGNYETHTSFLNAVISSLESNLVNFTLWNYNPNNDNTHGDHWNGEDFSIFSRRKDSSNPDTESIGGRLHSSDTETAKSQLPEKPSKPKSKLSVEMTQAWESNSSMNSSSSTTSIPMSPFELTEVYFDETLEGDPDHAHHIGGRALDAVVRPYACKIAGDPVESKFDLQSLSYTLKFTTTGKDAAQTKNSRPTTARERLDILIAPEGLGLAAEVSSNKEAVLPWVTEIFVPNFHYKFQDGASIEVQVSDGEWVYVQEKQTLYWVREESSVEDGATKEHWVKIACPKFKNQAQTSPAVTASIAVAVVAAIAAAGFALLGRS